MEVRFRFSCDRKDGRLELEVRKDCIWFLFRLFTLSLYIWVFFLSPSVYPCCVGHRSVQIVILELCDFLLNLMLIQTIGTDLHHNIWVCFPSSNELFLQNFNSRSPFKRIVVKNETQEYIYNTTIWWIILVDNWTIDPRVN